MITTWQLQPEGVVHSAPAASTQYSPEQHVALVDVHGAAMPEHVDAAWQLSGPPSGLSQVSPLQHGGPEVCEQVVPPERHVPASGCGGAHR